MKSRIQIIILLLAVTSLTMQAQQFTAFGYWKMENDSSYTALLARQAAGDTLNPDQVRYLGEMKQKLNNYFTKLSDTEKATYYLNRSKWNLNQPPEPVIVQQREQEVFAGEKSLFSKYLITSGFFGYLYGWSTIGVFGIDNEGMIAGLPFLTAGASALLPLAYIKDRNISPNSLQLAIHGKTIGAMQGAALGFLFSGQNAEGNLELILGLSTLSSITLGHIGYYFGKTKPWTEGRVELFNLYGVLMPFEFIGLTTALTKSESVSLYSAAFMAGGAAGYYIADRIADANDYTKGDIVSTQSLTMLGGLLGFGLIPQRGFEDETRRTDVLLPVIGTLGGALAGHLLLKDTRLTNQQGRNTALAAGAGALVGAGIMTIASSDSPRAYILAACAGGTISYAVVMNKYRKENTSAGLSYDTNGRWNLNFMPQNILFNRPIAGRLLSDPAGRHILLPAFSASLAF